MTYDVAIVGAGIAGASLAAEIAPHASVLLLEAEARPGYHSTGRSAAFWSESYGGVDIQPLTTASGPWLARPPAHYGESFLSPRVALHIGRADSAPQIDAFAADFAAAGVHVERVDPSEWVPGLRSDWSLGLLEPSCTDIDVARLHAAYLAAARRAGAVLLCDAALEWARADGEGWALTTRAGSFTAGVLVDAAGAWADATAMLAGVAPLGIRPYRRTVAQLRVSPPPPADLPLVIDIDGRFYFKPEAGRLWLSPHDETPADAHDVAAEELDVALAIDRMQQVVDWQIEAVEHRWAGLRSFAPDRLPVYGFDGDVRRFFWFAGQGGFGIQTAPAAAKLAAAVLLGQAPDAMVAGIDPRRYAPERFGR